MTYRELLNQLKSLPEDVLDNVVVITDASFRYEDTIEVTEMSVLEMDQEKYLDLKNGQPVLIGDI